VTSAFSLPEGPVTLDNLTLPGPLIGADDALVSGSVTINDGVFSDEPAATRINCHGRMALPSFVDMHTHLDKGHIWPRTPNPDGTFDGALSSVGEDREAKWSAEDVRARMTFALESAYAHGTKAIRTHLDSIPPQDEISWAVFDEVRADWKGRIDLQAVSLVGADGVEPMARRYQHTADWSQTGGVLGMVTYPLPDLEAATEGFFAMARARGLDADFHVDETGDPSVATLRQIAQVV
jgi:cytosine deaminase